VINSQSFDIDTWAARYEHTPTLITEQPHPHTCALSTLTQHNLPQAIQLWYDIEVAALEKLTALHSSLQSLQRYIDDAIRIILVGCGSSGRLAYWIANWVQTTGLSTQVQAVLAGGTPALIQSQEGLEDSFQAGASALSTFDLQPQDIVIGLAASGRTPFVLGALQAAQRQGAAAWLLTNNPTSLILPQLPDPSLIDGIIIVPLNVGPMVLTGSTRLQATTAMQVALILLFDAHYTIQDFITYLKQLDWAALTKTIHWEAQALEKPPVCYVSDTKCLLTVLADITERAPTFNVPTIRQPNTLWYVQTDDQTELNRLAGFVLPQQADVPILQITTAGLSTNQQLAATLPAAPTAIMQVGLKCLLNCHSTLVMGRRGYYQGNLMTHLRPTNAKLIDRAVRYILALDSSRNYHSVAKQVLAQLPSLTKGASLVQHLLER